MIRFPFPLVIKTTGQNRENVLYSDWKWACPTLATRAKEVISREAWACFREK